MGNNKANITGSKIQELGRKARTDKCGILLVRMITIYSAPKKQIMIKGGLLPEQ